MKKTAAALVLSGLMAFSGCQTQAPRPSAQKGVYGDTQIAQSMGVPEHYTFSTQSESGKSKVRVDADVVVPPVNGVDVLKANPKVFTDEEIQEFVRRHTNGFEWEHVMTKQPYRGEGLETEELDEQLMGMQRCSLWLQNQSSDDGVERYRNLSVNFWIEEKTGDIAYTPSLTYVNTRREEDPSVSTVRPLNEQNRADDCTISLEQAIAFAQEEIQHIFPDFFLSQYGQLDDGGSPYRPGYYVLKYTRKLNGIPVNIDIRRGVGDGSDYTAGTESVWMTVNDDGVCWLEYANPVLTGELVEENVDLLPFDAIMEIFEKVSLLSIQHLEIYEELVETVMDIKEIRFGYMAVRQSESIGGYRYIPVWDFYGLSYPVYEGNQYFPETFDEPVFTINAMDGTVIDRDMGY